MTGIDKMFKEHYQQGRRHGAELAILHKNHGRLTDKEIMKIITKKKEGK